VLQKEQPNVLYKSNASLSILHSRMSQYAGTEICILLLLYGSNLSNCLLCVQRC